MASGRIGDLIKGAAEQWARRAAGCRPFAPSMPLHRFVGEAFELAMFVEEYWEPRPDVGLPGLAAVASADFEREMGNELRELALALLHWEAKLKAAYEPKLEAPVERARFVLSELFGALEFVLGKDEKGRNAAAVRELRRHSEPSTHDGLALALEAVAQLADKHRPKLAKLPGVDARLPEEARKLARALREHSALRLTSSDDRSSLRNTRLRVCRLLHERVTAARAAVRFVFRAYPELSALATSEYKRTSRATQRAERRAQ